MSTRANIHFNYPSGQIAANIYRHGDGYPDDDYGVLADLDRFFTEVEAQTDDTRFNDPSYLAAKFVVWQAGKNAKARGFASAAMKPGDGKLLNFLSVGIVMEDAGDSEFVYEVTATSGWGSKDRPAVTYREAR
jgi:hypothetical protein